MTPEALHQLRRSLPAYAESSPPGELLQRFLNDYGLDFSTRFPEHQYRGGTLASGPFQLMVHHWQHPAARANLLLVHGYFDHTGLYDKLVAYGLSRQCNVLAFDLPGHGLSSGEAACIDDFFDYGRAIEDVLAQVPQPSLPQLAIGQSTGCAALMALARLGSWRFDAVAMLAPLVRPASWRTIQVGLALLGPWLDSVPRGFNRNSSDADFLAFVKADPLQSRRTPLRWLAALRRWLAGLPLADLGVGAVQVIQGRRDGTVDWRYNMAAVAKLFPGTSVYYLEEAGHQLANEAEPLREHYYAVLDGFLFDGEASTS